MRFIYLLLFLCLTPHYAYANAADRVVAANLIATLIDIPLLWTIYISLRTRNTIAAVTSTLVGTFLIGLALSPFSPTDLSYETLLTALWSQATLGLFIHRAISFCKSRPLFDRADICKIGNMQLVQWVWTERAINLINRWARRLDMVTLPLIALLPLAYFSFQLIAVFFVLYALTWGLYIYMFAGLILAIEGGARLIFSAFKNGIHKKVAQVATDKLCEINQDLSERKVFRRIADWFISGFDSQSQIDSQPQKAPDQGQQRKRKSWGVRLFLAVLGICTILLVLGFIVTLTSDDHHGKAYEERMVLAVQNAEAQTKSLLEAEQSPTDITLIERRAAAKATATPSLGLAKVSFMPNEAPDSHVTAAGKEDAKPEMKYEGNKPVALIGLLGKPPEGCWRERGSFKVDQVLYKDVSELTAGIMAYRVDAQGQLINENFGPIGFSIPNTDKLNRKDALMVASLVKRDRMILMDTEICGASGGTGFIAANIYRADMMKAKP